MLKIKLLSIVCTFLFLLVNVNLHASDTDININNQSSTGNDVATINQPHSNKANAVDEASKAEAISDEDEDEEPDCD